MSIKVIELLDELLERDIAINQAAEALTNALKKAQESEETVKAADQILDTVEYYNVSIGYMVEYMNKLPNYMKVELADKLKKHYTNDGMDFVFEEGEEETEG